MANKKRSAVSRFNYHKARATDRTITENKRIYSRNWIDGFTDKHARQNYSAVCSEISAKKGRMSKTYSVILNGYRNGLKAQIERGKTK